MKELIIKVDDPGERAWDGSPKTFEIQELVRCKDCRWGDWSRNVKGEEMIFCYNGDTGIEDGYLHEPDWFCAEGERRTDDA